ncbi:hypothetical protein KVH17_02365 [Streptomyces olivaceus]|uniref:hypothetical protein n=1 Tax=Streptomyces olivaceus TaxID=47716 RepID=UPI001CCB2D95|nr:hypothetical protein [Streptomyces olivaceus]MBZ6198556.1 hypothetical protein [Streptomyces olivaceus]
MADEQNEWLDRETAELLLCGESPEAVHPGSRKRAERLAAALGALSAPPGPQASSVSADAELPGEEAALAAFRKVNAERSDASARMPAALGRGTPGRTRDAGPVRLGRRGDGTRRPRRHRPLRLGLAAALTVGMVGSVAVAAGTGVLPAPFGGTEPEPVATVSAAASPERPLMSPSPGDGAQEGTQGGPSSPVGTAPGVPDEDTGRDSGEAGDPDAGDRAAGGTGGHRPDLVESCRRVGAGKELDDARARALKQAAGGAWRVGKYCGALLAAGDSAGGGGEKAGGGSGPAVREGELRWDTGDGRGHGDRSDRGGESGKSGKGGENGKGGNGGGNGEGDQGKGGKNGDGEGGRGDDGDGGEDDGPDGDDSRTSPVSPPVRHSHQPRQPHRSHHANHSRATDTTLTPHATATP